jgi:NADPH:quinone reductase-like Zn-dependent oxidoreductase
MMKELDILGTAVWNIERPAIAAALADVLRGLSDGSLCAIVGQRFALADAGEAQRAVMRPARQGKIVLDLGAEAV